MENMGDPDIEELKEIVKRQGEVIEETNRMVHGMRRGQRWRFVWSMLWWTAVLLISAGAYYYYVQPYVEQIQKVYAGFQQQAQKAETIQGQITDWFKQITGGAGTTTPQ